MRGDEDDECTPLLLCIKLGLAKFADSLPDSLTDSLIKT